MPKATIPQRNPATNDRDGLLLLRAEARYPNDAATTATTMISRIANVSVIGPIWRLSGHLSRARVKHRADETGAVVWRS